jgi:hypothetical protein
MSKIVQVIAAVLAIGVVPSLSQAQTSPPLVFITPVQNGVPAGLPPNGTSFREMCLNPQSWPTAWARQNAFGAAVQFFETLTNAELSQCFTNLKNAGKTLIVAGGSLRAPHCNTGAECFAAHIGQFNRIASLSPPPVILELDEPLTHGGFAHDIPYVVAQTVDYIRLVRQLAPGLPVMLDEAYPAQPYTTLGSLVHQINAGAIAQTGVGIQYFMLDHDWTAPGGNFAEIAAMRDYVRSIGVKFGVLFWQSGWGDWLGGLMTQGINYRNAGINPDVYFLNNFVGSPTTSLPENQGGTYTHSLREFVNAFLPVSNTAYGLVSGEYLLPNQGKSSVDNRFRLVYQGDGNLVLYRTVVPTNPNTWIWLWQTGQTNLPGGAWMQDVDGNFVVYNFQNGSYVPWWSSGTSSSSNAGAYLVVQSDSNLVIYRGSTPIWSRPNFIPGLY